MIIDSHFHALSMRKRGIEELPEDLIGIDIGTDAGDVETRISILPPSESIFISVGSGPWVLDSPSYISPEDERSKLLSDIAHFGADAIGECGFDMHWKYGTEDEQRALLMMQAELASELDLPIIIHTRDADRETSEALRSTSFRCSGIMHCFSSGPDIARLALDKGLYVSFAGNVTYKANEIIRESARIVPAERILIETDSPYLAPIPMRGRPSCPEYTEYTLSFLADLRGEDREWLKEKVRENLISVLGREESVTKGARTGQQ